MIRLLGLQVVVLAGPHLYILFLPLHRDRLILKESNATLLHAEIGGLAIILLLGLALLILGEPKRKQSCIKRGA